MEKSSPFVLERPVQEMIEQFESSAQPTSESTSPIRPIDASAVEALVDAMQDTNFIVSKPLGGGTIAASTPAGFENGDESIVSNELTKAGVEVFTTDSASNPEKGVEALLETAGHDLPVTAINLSEITPVMRNQYGAASASVEETTPASAEVGPNAERDTNEVVGGVSDSAVAEEPMIQNGLHSSVYDVGTEPSVLLLQDLRHELLVSVRADTALAPTSDDTHPPHDGRDDDSDQDELEIAEMMDIGEIEDAEPFGRIGLSFIIRRELGNPFPKRSPKPVPPPAPSDITISLVHIPRVPFSTLEPTPPTETLEADWISTSVCKDDGPVLMWTHGGGYKVGEKEMPRPHAYAFARAGIKVLSIEYRLAPENPYPAALADTHSAYKYLLAQGISPSRIILAGDSAGGNATLALTLFLRDSGEQLPAGLVLFSPWVDLTSSTPTLYLSGEFDCDIIPAANKDPLESPAATYTSKEKFHGLKRNVYVSPMFDTGTGLPPQYITTGTHDRLLGENLAYVVRRTSVGEKIQLEIYENQSHVFQITDNRATQMSYASVCKFVLAATSGKPVASSYTFYSDPASGDAVSTATALTIADVQKNLAGLIERARTTVPWLEKGVPELGVYKAA
ncbi:hypothetical protein HDU93_002109, partial [Gonapodya sp. JEL0774]